MVDKYLNVQQFLALSELYLLLTGKPAADISSDEIEEFLEAINDCPLSYSHEEYLT